MLPANHSFQGGERLILFQMGPFNKVEEKNVTLERKPFVLEAAAFSVLFSGEK
jgi:hypothetical protein